MGNLTGFVKRLRDIMRNDAGINGDAQRIEQIAWMLFLKVYDAKEQDWEFDEEDYTSIIPAPCRWCNCASFLLILPLVCAAEALLSATAFSASACAF